MRWLISLCSAAMMAFWSTSDATTIVYDLSNVAGNTWQYDFTITNDTLPGAIDEFTVFFDRNLFENLQAGSQPADWDPFVAQPDPSIPADGFFDVLALAGGIDPGTTLGGFQVLVDFLGTSTPGNPYFTIVDPNSFATIAEGVTRSSVAAQVPEPGTLALFAAALLAAGMTGARRRGLWSQRPDKSPIH